MCVSNTDQDFSLARLNHNNFTEKLVRLQEEGYLSPFLLQQFLANKSRRINNNERKKH